MADIAVLGLRVDASGALQQIGEVEAALAKLGGRAKVTEGETDNLGKAFGKLKGLLAGVAFAAVARQAVELSDAYTNLRARLSLVTNGAENLTRIQNELFAASQRSRTSFEATADLYGKLARSSGQLGLSQAELLKITNTINQSLTISGASSAGASAALVQLGQAFSSGTLRGEELNSVLEQAPRLAQALAEGLGVTVGQLRALGAAGELETGRVAAGLLKAAESVDSDFAKIPLTVGGAVQQVRNSLLQFVGGAGSASGASLALATTISKAAGAIEPLGNALAFVISVLGDAVFLFKQVGDGLGLLAAKASFAGEALASLATGDLAGYRAAIQGINVVTQEQIAQDEKVLAQLRESAKLRAQIGKAAGPGGDLLGGGPATPNPAAAAKAAAAKAEIRDRILAAEQELALVGKIDEASKQTAVRNKAEQERRKAIRDLKGEELTLTLAAIAAEERIGAAEVRAEFAKDAAEAATKAAEKQREFLEDLDKRVKLAADAVIFAGLEGDALARAQLEARTALALEEARANLAGKALRLAEDKVRLEAQFGEEAIKAGAALRAQQTEREKAKKKAEEIAEAQKKAAENFERQFLGTLSSGIEGVLKSGTEGFQDFATSIKTLILKVFADILAAQVFKKLTGALGALIPTGVSAQGAPGGIGGAGGFGAAGKLGALGAGAGIAFAGFGVGSAVGGLTTNRGAGALGGAASGAATGALLGSVVPVIGTAVGAIVGGIAGAVGGFLGASKKAKELEKKAAETRATVEQALANLAAGVNPDKLAVAVEATKKEFDNLRAAVNAGFQGKKFEAERTAALAKINAAEAQRIAQLREEAALVQRRAQEDLKVRELAAEGRIEEAAALAFAVTQQREYADAVKNGADATTLAALATTQAAEAARFAAEQQKAAAKILEDQRRAIFAAENDAASFTDPRGAAIAREAEERTNRIFDAIQRGATAAELAAIAFFNAAEEAAQAAERLENDRRTTESLVSRGLAAGGDARGAESAALAASQRQELADAIASGFSPTNLALLEFVQFSEREAVLTRRAIEDGTTAINELARAATADLDVLIEVTRSAAARQIAAIDAQIGEVKRAADIQAKGFDAQIAAIRETAKLQIDKIDAQIAAARNGIEAQKATVSALEKSVATGQAVAEGLQKFTDNLKLGDLSTLSPEAKLAEARSQFEALAARAQGGDAAAAQQLPEAANALLQASRGFNASNSGFVEDFNRVTSVIDAVRTSFGESLTKDAQALEAARAGVTATEAAVVALEQQKEAITLAAEQSIAVVEEAKLQAAEDARKLIEALEAQKETISADANATIAKLEEQKIAIREAADRQIEQLIADENAKLATRLRENEFYDLFQSYAGASGEFFRRSIEALDRPDGLGGNEGLTGGTGAPGAGASSPVAETLTQQVTELRDLNRALSTGLERVSERLDRLTAVTVSASEEEVRAVFLNVDATNNVAAEVRAGAQAAAVRRPIGGGGGGGGVGFGV